MKILTPAQFEARRIRKSEKIVLKDFKRIAKAINRGKTRCTIRAHYSDYVTISLINEKLCFYGWKIDHVISRYPVPLLFISICYVEPLS